MRLAFKWAHISMARKLTQYLMINIQSFPRPACHGAGLTSCIYYFLTAVKNLAHHTQITTGVQSQSAPHSATGQEVRSV